MRTVVCAYIPRRDLVSQVLRSGSSMPLPVTRHPLQRSPIVVVQLTTWRICFEFLATVVLVPGRRRKQLHHLFPSI